MPKVNMTELFFQCRLLHYPLTWTWSQSKVDGLDFLMIHQSTCLSFVQVLLQPVVSLDCRELIVPVALFDSLLFL